MRSSSYAGQRRRQSARGTPPPPHNRLLGPESFQPTELYKWRDFPSVVAQELPSTMKCIVWFHPPEWQVSKLLSQLQGTPSPHMPKPTSRPPTLASHLATCALETGSIKPVLWSMSASPTRAITDRTSCGSRNASWSTIVAEVFGHQHLMLLAPDRLVHLSAGSPPTNAKIQSRADSQSRCWGLPGK